MKSINLLQPAYVSQFFACLCILFFSLTANAQIPPPGYEREVKIREEKAKLQPLDRDSVMLIDTAVIFDPNSYQSEVIITRTNYSLRDYCIRFLGVQQPDILMDGKPHTIVDPKTYDDLIIRLNPSGKIDTIPK